MKVLQFGYKALHKQFNNTYLHSPSFDEVTFFYI